MSSLRAFVRVRVFVFGWAVNPSAQHSGQHQAAGPGGRKVVCVPIVYRFARVL